MAQQNCVKIEIIDSDSGSILNTLNFSQAECPQIQDQDNVETVIQRSQTGKPTLFINSDEWQILQLNIRMKFLETLTKLTHIYNAAKSGHYFRVYPHLLLDDSLYFSCFMSPAQWPRETTAFGRQKAGEIVRLEFLEKDHDYPIMDDDVIIT
ncbi:MAG: hypothetical protein A2Y94_13905 [Caldithrix sp. RBG_13_44_9]|nr:MAG: hypothetical protein A2Y94_13905 [Caldithrix sp. RBG_13_44_9]